MTSGGASYMRVGADQPFKLPAGVFVKSLNQVQVIKNPIKLHNKIPK